MVAADQPLSEWFWSWHERSTMQVAAASYVA
jgi:hypothetical protein